MLFGAKARFGIECQLKSFADPQQPIWGAIWIWASGQRLGEASSSVDVALIASMFCASLMDRSRREDELLMGKDKDEIWNTIQEALFGETEDKAADKVMQDSERYHKFLICGGTEGFDNVFGVLVEDACGERFIWRSSAWIEDIGAGEVEPWGENVHEVVLNPSEYESVVESFLNWLETETGFRPEIRDWVELSENEREAIRQDLIKRKPSLARSDRRLLLDRAAREELAQRRGQKNAGITGVCASGGKGFVP